MFFIINSKGVFPFLSPIPLTVACMNFIPKFTHSIEFANANPRSL